MQLPCQNNSYVNYTHAVSCLSCEEGFYCEVLGVSMPCPKGYYCPAGTVSPIPCPVGTYSKQVKLSSQEQCLSCPGGKFCNQLALSYEGSGDCAAGFFCFQGAEKARPGLQSNSSCECGGNNNMTIGGICPRGHYCPTGSINPIPCQAGTFSSREGANECQICPAGFFCPVMTSDYTTYPCPAGTFCVKGSQVPQSCPSGTFSAKLELKHVSECQSCSPGQFCAQPGLVKPTGQCLGGYFCSEGSSTSRQNECPIGFYCPRGSSTPTLCEAGYYCPVKLLNSSYMPCSAGYFCSQGSSKYRPPNGSVFGGPCPKGRYCPEGSAVPELCPPGTHNEEEAAQSISECVLCPAGTCCPYFGMEKTDRCSPGYYCPGNESSCQPLLHKCQPGHYCPTNSSFQIQCPSGFFQDEELATVCKDCPAGYYCENKYGPVLSYRSYSCPKGYYCPNKTETEFQYPCPVGTYNDELKRKSITDCKQCQPGYACTKIGLDKPDKPCNAGYICRGGSDSPSPEGADLNTKCPPGHYCPKGSLSPMPCPQGTYNPNSIGQSIHDCQPCDAGHYCNETGMLNAGPNCIEGFYCGNGSVSPKQLLCPSGYFCPNGVVAPIPCPEGTYSDLEGLAKVSQCKLCLESFYCPKAGQSKVVDPCVAGFYCPPGEKIPNKLCPKGFFCPNGTSHPQQCLPGTFTSTDGRSDCLPCDAGFYCSPVELWNVTENITPCPKGFFCPVGSSFYSKKPCPQGTYNSRYGLQSETQCSSCSPGSFCAATGLEEPSGLCEEGYYCEGNATSSQERICPAGTFCPEGSATPYPCRNGTFSIVPGSKECQLCKPGYFCPPGTSDYTLFRCPAGSFCPKGTSDKYQFLCEEGTFNPYLGMKQQTDCSPCPPGKYCMGKGLTSATGECKIGYYCSGGANTAIGKDGEDSECPKGTYCPLGSVEPQPCSEGYFCDRDGLGEPSGKCFAGYYCLQKSTTGMKFVCH